MVQIVSSFIIRRSRALVCTRSPLRPRRRSRPTEDTSRTVRLIKQSCFHHPISQKWTCLKKINVLYCTFLHFFFHLFIPTLFPFLPVPTRVKKSFEPTLGGTGLEIQCWCYKIDERELPDVHFPPVQLHFVSVFKRFTRGVIRNRKIKQAFAGDSGKEKKDHRIFWLITREIPNILQLSLSADVLKTIKNIPAAIQANAFT